MGLNRFTGSPWHMERWHREEGEKRRHRSNCVYFYKESHYCRHYRIPCYGSGQCPKYKEREAREKLKKPETRYDAKLDVKREPENKETININELILDAKKRFPVGSSVKHIRLGKGVVLRYEDEFVIVRFSSTNQEKTLRIYECMKNNLLD